MDDKTIPHTIRKYLSKQRINKGVEELAKRLTNEYTGLESQTVFICVLKGAFMFTADLVRCLPLNIPIEFCRARSYGDDMETSGEVSIQLPPQEKIAGKYCVILEDIIDTGLTMKKVIGELEKMRAKRVEVCTLLSKPSRRKVKVPVRYIGFEVPDLFFVGYGIDYAELYRNLDYLAVIVPTKKLEQ